MSSFRTVSILTFVLACALLWDECCGQSNQRRRQRNRNTPRRGEGLPTDLQEAYLNAVDGHNTPTQSEDEGEQEYESVRERNPGWEDLAPSTPASNEVECMLEVTQRRRLGGRCTRLGGTFRPYICQSGQHFVFDTDCARIMNSRYGRQPNS